MERTLKVVQARHAIEAIVFAYAEAVDRGDIETVGELLPECELVMPNGDTLKGGTEISEHYQKVIMFYDDQEQLVSYQRHACTPRTQHVTTNLQFDFSGDARSAQVKSYFTVTQTLGGTMSVIAGGRYLDRFEAHIHGWRMRERRVVIDHTGDMSRHIHGAGA